MRPGEAQKTGIDGSEVFDRMRSHWLSNVIHDLSGALFAARGYLRMVLEEPNGALPEPQRRYLTSSLENVGRLVALTQELNDFPAKDWFEFDTVAFDELLHQAIAEVRAASLESNVQVIEEVDNGLLPTIGDPGKLTSAVKAFLAAAFEFTGPGGTVRVRAREENEKIMVQFVATPRPGRPPDNPSVDLSLACKILRLHGGSAFVGTSAEPLTGGYLITCELPVIRLSEC
jgi:signal transduction histidine kinase